MAQSPTAAGSRTPPGRTPASVVASRRVERHGVRLEGPLGRLSAVSVPRGGQRRHSERGRSRMRPAASAGPSTPPHGRHAHPEARRRCRGSRPSFPGDRARRLRDPCALPRIVPPPFGLSANPESRTPSPEPRAPNASILPDILMADPGASSHVLLPVRFLDCRSHGHIFRHTRSRSVGPPVSAEAGHDVLRYCAGDCHRVLGHLLFLVALCVVAETPRHCDARASAQCLARVRTGACDEVVAVDRPARRTPVPRL